MKYITISLLIITFLLTSCTNEDRIISQETLPASKLVSIVEVKGVVAEEFSHYSYNNSSQRLNNVSVRLMHDGITLDEVNTNEQGIYTFPEQPVPIEEAYLIFEARGFHKNVCKISNTLNPDQNYFNNILIRKTFEGLTGDDITDEGPYINLQTGPADRDQITPVVYYITNAENELIGARRNYVEILNFDITTLANEPLYLHYLTECSDQTIEIGPFDEDTDITDLLGELAYDQKDRQSARTKAFDCNGTELPVQSYDKFSKIDGVTRWSANNTNISSIGGTTCLLQKDPFSLVSIALQNPRRYGEVLFEYFAGQEYANITVCEADDTYLNYSIGGGAEVVPDLFTFANILPDGSMLLKLKDPVYPGGTDVAFEINSSTTGSTQGAVLVNNWPEFSTNVSTVGYEIDLTISSNDGSFIEGTFDGPVFDAFESPLGNLSGTFRARIQ